MINLVRPHVRNYMTNSVILPLHKIITVSFLFNNCMINIVILPLDNSYTIILSFFRHKSYDNIVILPPHNYVMNCVTKTI